MIYVLDFPLFFWFILHENIKDYEENVSSVKIFSNPLIKSLSRIQSFNSVEVKPDKIWAKPLWQMLAFFLIVT